MNNDRTVATCNKANGKRVIGVALSLVLTLALAATASAQKKKKKDEAPPANASSIVSVPDEQKIDYTIGQMLGAWQVGDIEKLHKAMADDVSVVSGTWAPPTMGWTNFLAAYQVQRARMQQVRMERSNTLVRVAPSAKFAWACYQWDFSAVVDGAPSASEGQTTLVLEKRGDDWIIVHNHSSLVRASQPVTPTSSSPQPAPTKP